MKTAVKYPVLLYIMQTKGYTVTDIANIAGISIPSAYGKMQGKTDWTLIEMRKIKEALRYRNSLDRLFGYEV